MRSINAIIFATIAIGNTDFTEVQKEGIGAIAQQCPLAGGKAVYLARSLRSHYCDNSCYDDESICAQAGVQYRKNNIKSVTLQDVKVYPNPTDDNLTLEINKDLQGLGNLQIMDLYGHILSEIPINYQDKRTEINTSNLLGGVYYLHLLKGNETIYAGKIVIIH